MSNKKIRYAECCSIILIPTRDEYVRAGIELWYGAEDFQGAVRQVIAEVANLMAVDPERYPTKDLALKALYDLNLHTPSPLETKQKSFDTLTDTESIRNESFDSSDERPFT